MDKSVYLAFYLGRTRDNPGSTLLDNIICLLTNSRYSHCELVLGIHGDIGNCWSSSRRDNGVRNKKIQLNKRWEVYKIDTTIPNSSFERFFMAEKGKSYDLLGALGVRFPFFKHQKSKWFCSEILAATWGLSNPQKYSPQDIYNYFINETYEQKI